MKLTEPVEVKGLVAVEGPLTIEGKVALSAPASIAGTVNVAVQGPVELASPMTLTQPVQIAAPTPIRMLTADTDVTRLVSNVYPGGWGASSRAIEKGPLILTSVALTASPFGESFTISASETSRMFYVSDDLPIPGDCSVAAASRTYVVSLQADVLPALSGARILIPEGRTLCITGANSVVYSGFRPY